MTIQTNLLVLTVVLVLLPSGAYAFGAGDIPDFSYLSEKAFRHGDIEGVISELVKAAGHSGVSSSGGILGFAKSVIDSAGGGPKFDRMDVKRVYFGNWLRDYSQAMDIAGLSKLSADSIVMLVSILGFMAFGYATDEFEVTADKLGVYLPVEHIDNPKGYAEKEGDARQFHPKLRPPVDRRELEIDERTGMKNYMATDNGGWDTSTAFIRRTLRQCIEVGRRAGGNKGPDLWEAYRLLGTADHTLQDLLAHSNWCEIGLLKMGHREVFCHVGDNVVVNTPNGRAPPLVTGTFGSADFMHSMLGEATDHISQASVTDLSEKMANAGKDGDSRLQTLQDILSKIPSGGGGDSMNKPEEIKKQSQGYNFNPDEIMTKEVQTQLWDVLKWRDGVLRNIAGNIESVPGLSDLLDEFTNALNAYVYTVLAPYLTPILTQVTKVLGEGSKAVIDSDDQFEVFNNPNASDPSHSLLSKDHFNLILNEPAGKIAQAVTVHTVTLIVKAWSENSNPDQVIDQILEAFHHPYYASGRSQIQHEMMQTLEKWFGGLGGDMERQVIQALTKESVKNGKNKRIGSENNQQVEPGYAHAQNFGGGGQQGGRHSGNQGGSYGSGQQHSSQQGSYGSTQGGSHGYGRQDDSSYSSSGGRTQESYGRNQESHGRRDDNRRDDNNYSGGGRNQDSYGRSQESYNSGRRDNDNYSSNDYGRHQDSHNSGRRDENSYGGRQGQESYSSGRSDNNYSSGGNQGSYGAGRRDDNTHSYGGHESGRRQDDDNFSSDRRTHDSHGDNRRDNDNYSSGYGGSNTGRNESGYGSNNYSHEQSRGSGHGSSYQRDDNTSGYGQRESHNESSYGRRQERDNNTSSGYEGSRQDHSYGSRGDDYSSGRNDRERDHSSHQSGYGESRNESSYGGRGHSSNEHGSGYGDRSEHGNSGRRNERSGYGDNDDTFGAERLNIDDRHHGGNRGGSSGYGSGGYGERQDNNRY